MMSIVALELDQSRYIPISIYKRDREEKVNIMFIKAYRSNGKDCYSSFLYQNVPFEKRNDRIYLENKGKVIEYKGQLPEILEHFYGERKIDPDIKSYMNENELWKHFEDAEGFIDSLKEIL